MYCRKCGAEILENSKFCGKCGTVVESVQSKSIDFMSARKTIVHSTNGKISSNKLKIIMVLVVSCVAVGLVSILVNRNNYSDREIEWQIQTSVNNLQNDGIVATDGTWLYYVNQGIEKVKLDDGSQQEVVLDDVSYVQDIFYVDDSLFYYSFPTNYRLKTDSTEVEIPGSGSTVELCIQYDGNYYYTNNSGNYNGTGIYMIQANDSDTYEKVSEIWPSKLMLYDDYLYTFSEYNEINNEENQYYGTWRINKDGGGEICLLEYCPEYMVFSEGIIYFTNEDDVLCQMDLDGENICIYENIQTHSGLNVSDEYVFYIDDDTGYIHRIDKNTRDNIILNMVQSQSLNVAGEWIFYVNRENYTTYKMNFDGSYNQPLY